MIEVDAPAALNGDQLERELAAAGIPDASVTLNGDTLEIVADGATVAEVQAVVAAHVPPPPAEAEPSLAERLTALERRMDKAASTSVTTADAVKLRDSLKPTSA